MKSGIALALLLLSSPAGIRAADEVSTFAAYVDSDICGRLMLGPITTQRVQCSQRTVKEGAQPILVRLSNNMVFIVNKQDMLRGVVGQLVEVSGKLKVNDGEMRLQSVSPISWNALPPGDPGRRLLDVRMHKAEGNAKLYEKIRHELAMMPYITNFDFISFTLNGSDVILTGWTVRATNRDTAARVVRDIEGVASVINNIDLLPLGSFDMQIRAAARAALQRFLSRYFWGSGSDIKIIVKNGTIILLGVVSQQSDWDIASIQCNAVPGVFKVFNLLQVQGSEKAA
jgi:hypothetical protein